MAITLTVVDDQDGTGATATIAGSDAGGTNTVYAQSLGSPTWVSAGSRVGDGTMALAIAAGHYFAYAQGLVSTVVALSNVAGVFPVTESASAIWVRLAEAIKSEIQTLITAGSVPGFSSIDEVSRMWALNDKELSLPRIFIIPPAGATEQLPGGTNIRDDWRRPFLVAMVHKASEDWVENQDDVMLARERLMRRLHNLRVTNVVSESMRLECIPGNVADFLKDGHLLYLISSFQIQAWTRETRL